MSNILTSLHGRQAGLDHKGRLIVPGGMRTGNHGSQFDLPSPSRVVWTDDFTGDALADQYGNIEGTAGNTDAGVLAGGKGGLLRLTTGASGTIATDQVGVVMYKNWTPVNGEMVMEARFKLSAITNVWFFMGFTDAVVAELSYSITGTTYTSVATDAVGILFDTNATDDVWRLVGVATDFDAANVALTAAPVADTFETWRINVNAAGTAVFYRNGVEVGRLSSALTVASGPFTPIITASVTAAAGRTVDVDYLHLSMDRV